MPGQDPTQPLCFHQGRWLSRGAFWQGVAAVAATLPAQDHLINLCEGRLGFMLVFCAALSRGKTVLLPQNRQPAHLEALRRDYPDLAYAAEQPLDTTLPYYPVSAWETLGKVPGQVPVKLACLAMADPAVIAFTSGSTGQPVAHAKSWPVLYQSTRAALVRFGLTRQPLVATVPPQHMYGLECSVLYPLIGGVPVHAGRPFYPEDLRQALCALAQPAILITTPVHLRAMLRAQVAWPPIARIISATAPLSLELAEEAQRRLGLPVDEIYGCTESGAIASRRLSEDPIWRLYDGLELHQERPGSSTRVSGLPWPEPVTLPDLLSLHDPHGFELMARQADLINVAGKRGSLAHLNALLLRVDGVEDGVVFLPNPAPQSAEIPLRTAALVVAPSMTVERILQALRAHIDPVFLPRPLLVVSSLPRTAAGKLQRTDLIAMLTARTPVLPEDGGPAAVVDPPSRFDLG